MPRPVIFDLDGVLVDSEPLYERALRAYLDGSGRSDEDELFALTLGRRQVDFLPVLAARLELSEEQVRTGLERALTPLLDGLRTLPYAAEVVTSLRRQDRRLGLATSSVASFAHRALRGLGIEALFHAIVTGEEVERGKPDPAIYRLAARRLDVDPASCVAIEDTATGVASAVEAGMTCIAIPHALSPASALGRAHLVAEDLRSAAALILELEARPSASGER